MNQTSITYYNDPNELIDRLDLLMSERVSGNTSNDVYNEINVIIDELVKKKIYTKSQSR